MKNKSLKFALLIVLLINSTACVSSNKKTSGTISCFNGGRLVLKMKSKERIKRDNKGTYYFENDEGFRIEVNMPCAVVYDNKKIYIRKEEN